MPWNFTWAGFGLPDVVNRPRRTQVSFRGSPCWRRAVCDLEPPCELQRRAHARGDVAEPKTNGIERLAFSCPLVCFRLRHPPDPCGATTSPCQRLPLRLAKSLGRSSPWRIGRRFSTARFSAGGGGQRPQAFCGRRSDALERGRSSSHVRHGCCHFAMCHGGRRHSAHPRGKSEQRRWKGCHALHRPMRHCLSANGRRPSHGTEIGDAHHACMLLTTDHDRLQQHVPTSGSWFRSAVVLRVSVMEHSTNTGQTTPAAPLYYRNPSIRSRAWRNAIYRFFNMTLVTA